MKFQKSVPNFLTKVAEAMEIAGAGGELEGRREMNLPEVFVVLEICCEDTGLVGAYSDFYKALAAVKKTAEGLDVELCFSDPYIEKKHGTFSLSDIDGEFSYQIERAEVK